MNILKLTQASYIDEEIQANPFLITSLKHASPEHYHDFYEFFFVISGKCIHRVNNCNQHLIEGSLVFIRPNDIHSYDYDGDSDCQFINIPCNTNVINEVFNYLGNEYCVKQLFHESPPYTILSPIELNELINRYERLKMLTTVNKAQANIQLKSMLVETLSQYFLVNGANSKNDIPLWLESLLTQMQKKQNFTIGLKRMYELSGRSAGHLNRIFKQQFNMTPTEYINNLKLNLAKNLLLTTNLSIIDISLECGFQNLSHFYHLFKQYFNITPHDFRATNEPNNIS